MGLPVAERGGPPGGGGIGFPPGPRMKPGGGGTGRPPGIGGRCAAGAAGVGEATGAGALGGWTAGVATLGGRGAAGVGATGACAPGARGADGADGGAGVGEAAGAGGGVAGALGGRAGARVAARGAGDGWALSGPGSPAEVPTGPSMTFAPVDSPSCGAAAFLAAAFLAAALGVSGSSGWTSRRIPSASALRRTRSAWASTMPDEWLLTPIPSASHRSRVSLLVSPSSRASS